MYQIQGLKFNALSEVTLIYETEISLMSQMCRSVRCIPETVLLGDKNEKDYWCAERNEITERTANGSRMTLLAAGH